jgi:hypothetical protein
MYPWLKVISKIVAVFAIGTLIFLGNLWLETHGIEKAKEAERRLNSSSSLNVCDGCMDGRSMRLGYVNAELGVSSFMIYLSAPLFVLLSLFLFKPNRRYILLVPLFVILWIVLSEFSVRFFHIPVIHSNLDGDIRVLHGLYFRVFNGSEFILPFLLFVSSFAGLVAYEIPKMFRKDFW